MICPQEVPPEVVNPEIPSYWIIAILFIIVAVFEIWVIKIKKRTISQTIQRLSKAKRWFRWLAATAMAILTWHIIWGFPW